LFKGVGGAERRSARRRARTTRGISMRMIVTAGPTREYLDDVRFISNASSGRMGYAIARAAARAGHSVRLVSGPVNLKPPAGVTTVLVTSTREMYDAVAASFDEADCLIGAAAPADFAPARRKRGKSKKGPEGMILRLKPTVDILARLGRRKSGRVIIAFALEVQKPLTNAYEKLKRKHADAVVLNSPAAMGAMRSDATILTASGGRVRMRNATKAQIARRLVALAESLRAKAEGQDGH